MGRHSADPGAEDDPVGAPPRTAPGPRYVAGPTTDPLLLDDVGRRPVTTGATPRSAPVRQQSPAGRPAVAPPPADLRAAPAPAPAPGIRTARLEPRPAPAPRTREVPDPPWAPRPVVRYDDLPFSGPVALPDPPEPDLRPRTAGVEVHDPRPPATLPALLDEPRGSLAADVPASESAEEAEDEPVGLSVRTLLLSLGVGVAVTVALSVVAVLPI